MVVFNNVNMFEMSNLTVSMYFCLFQKEKVTQIIVVLSFIFALLKFYYCMLHIEIYLFFSFVTC